MNPQFTIRTTHENDMRAYRELRLEALKNYPTAFGMDYETSAAQPESYWLERIRASDDRVAFVAEAGGQFVGTAGIFRESNIKERHASHIWGVYVRPAWRGAGIADALIETCISWAQARELRLVKLAVTTTNTAAIRCYLRHGFSVYGVEPEAIQWDGVYYDELLMVRRLV
jgi:RimJ/RimL family protein N-acetyltransferase